MAPGWSAVGRVRVEVGNRITQRMTQLPSGDIHSGELEPNPLGLGLASSGVGDARSGLWRGVVSPSLIVRLVVPLVRGSTTDDPFLLLL
jgi:hypothetical protein